MKKNNNILLFATCFIISVFMLVGCTKPTVPPEPQYTTYTIVWKNYDGSILETDTDVREAGWPSYDGITPTKPDDEDFTYEFENWNPHLHTVDGDQTYTAVFTPIPKRTYESDVISLEGFEEHISGNSKYYTLTVPNSVTSFDFTNLITVSEDATFKINHEDYATPDDNMVFSLNEGRNRIFIHVYSKYGESDTYYRVDLYRNHLYTVNLRLFYKTFNYNDEVIWEQVPLTGEDAKIYVEEGNCVPMPTYEKRLGFDYTFGDYDFETPITAENYDAKRTLTITGTVKDEMRVFKFTSDEENCEITEISGKAANLTEIVFPEYITKINLRRNIQLSNDSNLTKVYWNAKHCIKETDADGIFSSGSNKRVDELIIGDTCEFIDSGMFGGVWFVKITVGTGLNEIKNGAFHGYNIYVKDLKQWFDIGYSLHTSNVNYYLNDELITELHVPEGITEIPDYLFYSCNFRKIYIPEGVTRIGNCAFRDCYQLQILSLPSTLTYIGESAFSGSSISKLEIPDSVTFIGDEAFSGSLELTRVVLGTGLTESNVGTNAFAECGIWEVYAKCNFPYSVGEGLDAYGKVLANAYRVIHSTDEIQDSMVHEIIGEDGNTYVCFDRYNSETMKSERILCAYYGDNPNLIIPSSITHIRRGVGNRDSYIESITFKTDVDNWNGGVLVIGSTVYKREYADSDIQTFRFCNNINYVVFGEGEYQIKTGCFERSYGYEGKTTVFYNGEKEAFLSSILKGVIYYYSETEPTDDDNYWHYVNGVATPWN